MTTDEAARLHLYDKARSAFDDAAANTLMTAIARDPDRFATKDDLATLEARLEARISIEAANLRGEMHALNSSLLRTLFFGMVGTNATLVGLVFAAVRLA